MSIGFVLSEMESEIEKLSGDNSENGYVKAKVVPNEVDEGSFWCRYFYKVYKLNQQEDVRAMKITIIAKILVKMCVMRKLNRC